MKLTTEEINLLNRIREYLNISIMTDLVYKTPAQQLRERADFEEKKERDIFEFQELLNKLNKVDKVKDF
jgi:hypothetical protein